MHQSIQLVAGLCAHILGIDLRTFNSTEWNYQKTKQNPIIEQTENKINKNLPEVEAENCATKQTAARRRIVGRFRSPQDAIVTLSKWD